MRSEDLRKARGGDEWSEGHPLGFSCLLPPQILVRRATGVGAMMDWTVFTSVTPSSEATVEGCPGAAASAVRE